MEFLGSVATVKARKLKFLRNTSMMGERLVFDSERERNFLRGLPPEVREPVLIREVRTAAYEAEFLPTYSRDYKLVNGRVFDTESRLLVADLVARGGRPEEIEAIKSIEEGLRLGKMMINFSPRNAFYDYKQDCVDFWRVEGEEVRWKRIVVKNNFEELREVWKNLGGQGEIENEFDLLARPVISEKKIGEVLQMLDLTERISRVGKERIDRVVERLNGVFIREFGLEKMTQPEMIFRFWSAVTAELDNREDRSLAFGGLEVRRYLYGNMRQAVRPSGGCSGFNLIGEFGSQGYYVVKKGGAMAEVVNRNGQRYCSVCGVKLAEGETVCHVCGLKLNLI